jgi:hypothetical protein
MSFQSITLTMSAVLGLLGIEDFFVFAFGLCHRFGLKHLRTCIAFNKDAPSREQHGRCNTDQRGVWQVRGIIMRKLKNRYRGFTGSCNDDHNEKSR